MSLVPQGEFLSDFDGNSFYSVLSSVCMHSVKETFVNKKGNESYYSDIFSLKCMLLKADYLLLHMEVILFLK